MRKHWSDFCVISVSVVNSVFMAASCGKNTSNSGAGIPLVEPPVTKATPAGLVSSAALLQFLSEDKIGILSLDISEVKSRFFSAGPTEIKNLLKSIDSRVDEINTRSKESTHDCLSTTPVEQTYTVFGQSQTVYFQCYDIFGDGSGGMLFGKKGDSWYLYTNVGQGRGLAVVAPISGSSGDYTVESWISVGQENTPSCSSTWYGCSYGGINLKANSATKAIEMTVAGTGFGYCGAHLKSEGTNLYVKGSSGGMNIDGTSWNCSTTDTVCTLSSSTAISGSCTAIGDSSFELQTLGVTGSSTFGTGITLDGSATDSLHFGPSVSGLSAIIGVTKF